MNTEGRDMIAYLEDKMGLKIATLSVGEFTDNRMQGIITTEQFPDEAVALLTELQEIVEDYALSKVDAQRSLIAALGYKVSADIFDESKEILDLQVFVQKDGSKRFSFYIQR